MPAVAVSHVSRTFAVGGRRSRRLVQAVEDVSFEVAGGEFVACLGPNGAGKSTLIKVLTGILHPSAGEVLVAGFSPQRRRVEVARRIGAVFGQRTQLWWDLPVRDSFDLLAAMYEVPPAAARERLRRLDAVLGLEPFLQTPVRQLSLGQRMRADLAGALLHDPSVLFLDEPTVGLDLLAREAVRRFLREVNRAGTTVLLTTHDMGDVEELCSRVLVMGGGRLVYDGAVDRLRAAAGLPTVASVEFARVPPALPGLGPLGEGGRVLRAEGAVVELGFDRARHGVGAVLGWLAPFGEVRDVRLSEPDLEAVLRGLYRTGDVPAGAGTAVSPGYPSAGVPRIGG